MLAGYSKYIYYSGATASPCVEPLLSLDYNGHLELSTRQRRGIELLVSELTGANIKSYRYLVQGGHNYV